MGIIEIEPHKIYISVSRRLFVQKNSLRALMKTLVSQRNRFEPSSERGNFLNLAKYGDIPSSHGDIPVVSFLILMYEVESTKYIFFGFLDISTLWKHFQGCFKCQRCKFFACTFYTIGFSFDANTQFILGFIDAIELVSISYSVFHFQQFYVFADCNYSSQYCSGQFPIGLLLTLESAC